MCAWNCLPQVQDLTLCCVEFQEVVIVPPIKVTLHGTTSVQHVNHKTQLGVMGKFAEGALIPLVHVADKGVKMHPSQY